MSSKQRRELMEERLHWLEKTQVELAATLKRVPFLIFTVLLAPPVYLWGGVGPAFLTLGTAITVTCVAMYVVWAHRNEYSGELKTIRSQLRQMDREAAGEKAPEAPKSKPRPSDSATWGG